MFTVGLKRLGTTVPLFAYCALAACNSSLEGDDSKGAPDAGSLVDTGAEDAARRDAGPQPHSVLPCTGGAALAITGNYIEANGTQHWLRRTASAVTYSRIPSGAANHGNPPALWSITQVCSDQKVFVARSETSKFARIDWTQDSAGVRLCVAIEDAPDAAAALSAALPVPGSATGCKGGAWTALTKKDGGQ